jgi:hypothetical protein
MGKPKLPLLLSLCLMLSLSDVKAQWTRAYASGNADGPGQLENFRHTLVYFAGDSTGIIASTDDGKTWTPDNAGLSWDPSGSPGKYFNSCRLSVAGGHLFASIDGPHAGLYVSENVGASWKPLPWSLIPDRNIAASRSLSVASNGSIYYGIDITPSLYAGGYLYSFHLDDTATTFVADPLNRGNVFPGLPGSAPRHVFSDLLIRNGLFIANTWMTGNSGVGGVLISRDSGKTWGGGTLAAGAYSIAGNDEFVFALTDRGIYRSSDDGVTWDVQITNYVFADTGSAGKFHVSAMYVSGKNIFVASYRESQDGWQTPVDQQVYFSDDNGASWKAIGTGIASWRDSYIRSISMSDSSVFVVVGKELWKRPLRDLSTGIRPFGPRKGKSGFLSGNGGVLHAGDRIGFTVGKTGWVDLGLYDGDGRRLQTLARSAMLAGPRSISFSPDKQRRGLFYLRLLTPGTTEARKVLIQN